MKTIIAIAAAISAAPVVAQPDTSPRAPTVAAPFQSGGPAAKRKETRYCVKDTITGSRMERKRCRTRAEWVRDGFDPLNPNK